MYRISALLVLLAAPVYADEDTPKFYLIDGKVVEKRLSDLEKRVADLESKTKTATTPVTLSPPGKFSAGVKVCDESGCRYVLPAAVTPPAPRVFTTIGGGHTHTCPYDGTTWDHSVNPSHNCPTCGRQVTQVSGGYAAPAGVTVYRRAPVRTFFGRLIFGR